MPRRIRDYLDRLSHRDTHREEPNTYTVNTTVNLNDLEWHPVRWNATQWFPDNEVPYMEVSRNTHQMLENAYNNMTARDVMEISEEATPENMLRLVRLAMPNITRNELIHETPMEVLENDHRLYVHDMNSGISYRPSNNVVYREYTPTWSNKTISWAWGDKRSGHVEFRRGRIIRVKRYCKI